MRLSEATLRMYTCSNNIKLANTAKVALEQQNTIEALQQENEHLKKLLRMAQFAMDGMIKTIGTEDEINKYYWWGELQKVSNMINDLEKENEE